MEPFKSYQYFARLNIDAISQAPISAQFFNFNHNLTKKPFVICSDFNNRTGLRSVFRLTEWAYRILGILLFSRYPFGCIVKS